MHIKIFDYMIPPATLRCSGISLPVLTWALQQCYYCELELGLSTAAGQSGKVGLSLGKWHALQKINGNWS